MKMFQVPLTDLYDDDEEEEEGSVVEDVEDELQQEVWRQRPRVQERHQLAVQRVHQLGRQGAALAACLVHHLIH